MPGDRASLAPRLPVRTLTCFLPKFMLIIFVEALPNRWVQIGLQTIPRYVFAAINFVLFGAIFWFVWKVRNLESHPNP